MSKSNKETKKIEALVLDAIKKIKEKETEKTETLRKEYQRIMDETGGLYDSSAFDRVLPLAKEGLPEAQCFVGEHYMYDDYDVPAEYWLRLSAGQHYPPAELALGKWLYYGIFSFKNNPECEQWFLLADKHGQTKACYYLGKLAEDKGDMAEACRWWEKGAEGYDENSQKELAFCYETGHLSIIFSAKYEETVNRKFDLQVFQEKNCQLV